MKDNKASYGSFAAVKEALSKIVVNLSFIDINKSMKCLLVTSAVASEGKSLLTSELCKTLAASGKKVLLVDADMRKATQHKLFRLNNRYGLSNIITSKADWKNSLNGSGEPYLKIIAAGPVPPNPTEILSSSQMEQFLNEVKSVFDYVIVDTPPVLPVSDTIALSRYADGIIFVTRCGKTNKKLVMEAKHTLSLAKAPLIGAVLNDVRTKSKSYYHKYLYEPD